MTTAPPVRFAVAGADHPHLLTLVGGLLRAGAEAVAHTGDGDLVAGYEAWQGGSQRRDLDGILGDDAVDLVVTAGVPSERAAVAVAALRAGKAVLSDKPGVTSRAQLEEVRAALAAPGARPGRPWTVLFSERLENRAVGRAVELARSGAVGRVAYVAGSAPHSMAADHRPDWFWDPARTGGILVDIGSHQVDQFLAVASPGDPGAVRVGASRVGNVSCPDRPAMQDVGSMTLLAPGVVGEHRVDWLSPPGLPAWGDVRLVITGTEGTLEVRANVDVDGRPGGEHLFLVDAEGARHVDVSGDPLPWPDLLVADLADGGERLLTQDHVLAVSDLSLRAQEQAGPWGVG